jgi:hypothetical protein
VAGSLDTVTEVNLQCLDHLASLGAGGTGPFAGQEAAWATLSGAARARLAASPYLLVDAGFGDEACWRALVERNERIAPAPRPTAFFTGAEAGDFVRRVFMLGWHLAHANRQVARVVLGMSPAVAGLFSQLKLRDLDWLAQQAPGLVRLRWEHQPRVWQRLLRAAGHEDGEQLTHVSLRGLQLMAADALASLRRPATAGMTT